MNKHLADNLDAIAAAATPTPAVEYHWQERDGVVIDGHAPPIPAPDHAQAREAWNRTMVPHRLEWDMLHPSLRSAYLEFAQALAASPQEGREAAVKALFNAHAVAKLSGKQLDVAAIVDVVADALRATPPVAPLPPVVTDEMVIDALMAFNGWGGEEYEAKLRESLRASIVFRDSRAVAMRAALTAALGAPQAAPVVTSDPALLEWILSRCHVKTENGRILRDVYEAEEARTAALAERPRG